MGRIHPSYYPKFVLKIWSEPDGHTERGVSIAGLGVIGEAGEVCEVLDEQPSNTELLVDECGDVLYYLTVLADWQGLTFTDVHAKIGFRKLPYQTRALSGIRLISATKEVSEMVKKWIRDGREYEQRTWLHHLGQVMRNVGYILQANGRDLQDALDANVTKLEVRYKSVLEGEKGGHQKRAENA